MKHIEVYCAVKNLEKDITAEQKVAGGIPVLNLNKDFSKVKPFELQHNSENTVFWQFMCNCMAVYAKAKYSEDEGQFENFFEKISRTYTSD